MAALLISIIIVIVLILVYSQSGNPINTNDSLNVPGVGTSKGGVNNPGFLIHTSTNWAGKVNSDGCKFENFESLEYGIRAWYINLFGKIQKGTIKTTSQMIDVLTPAGSDNPEQARNNYKASVMQATSYLQLGQKVFDFEANPNWKNAPTILKNSALQSGLQQAVNYKCGGNLPPFLERV